VPKSVRARHIAALRGKKVGGPPGPIASAAYDCIIPLKSPLQTTASFVKVARHWLLGITQPLMNPIFLSVVIKIYIEM